MQLSRPAPSPLRASVQERGKTRIISVTGSEGSFQAEVLGDEQESWIQFFADAAARIGTRAPGNRRVRSELPVNPALRPLLVEPISNDILYGYGDPWARRVEEEGCYYLAATSNDAPQSFPILRSNDLRQWELAGFAFPAGHKPDWALDEFGSADFWAPEIHRIGGRYAMCFSARQLNKELAIGLAWADKPAGPYLPTPEPLIGGGVIDAHVFVDRDGKAYLYWKEDNNDLWPGLLIELLFDRPDLSPVLFPNEADQRTVELLSSLWPWIRQQAPMERFFVLQILIEAATRDYADLIGRLEARRLAEPALDPRIARLTEAMHTPVHGQRLTADGRLEGESFLLIKNDLAWEGPLIEGMCMTRQDGRYFLFYSGNDFSTPEYGIGYAVGDSPEGPFRKAEEPLMRSSRDWWGPGHPSLTISPDGRPLLVMHAYRAGKAGYKVFRAALAVPLLFSQASVEIDPRPLDPT